MRYTDAESAPSEHLCLCPLYLPRITVRGRDKHTNLLVARHGKAGELQRGLRTLSR